MGYCPKCVLTKGPGRRWAGHTECATGAGTHAAGAGTLGTGRSATQGVRGAGARGGHRRARQERAG